MSYYNIKSVMCTIKAKGTMVRAKQTTPHIADTHRSQLAHL